MPRMNQSLDTSLVQTCRVDWGTEHIVLPIRTTVVEESILQEYINCQKLLNVFFSHHPNINVDMNRSAFTTLVCIWNILADILHPIGVFSKTLPQIPNLGWVNCLVFQPLIPE